MLQADHPAELFAKIWAIASSWGDVHLNMALSAGLNRDLRELIVEALEKDDAGAATNASLRAARLPPVAIDDADTRRRLAALLLSIDAIFERVHPRAVLLGGRRRRPYIPTWLLLSRRDRTKSGRYFETDSDLLIPRGTLSRTQRTFHTEGGVSLVGALSSLTMAAKQFKHGQKTVSVSQLVITAHSYEGVARLARPSKAGYETVAFMPLARSRSEIVVSHFEDQDGVAFIECAPAANFESAKEFSDALDELKDPVDIAIAPEFVVSASESQKMLDGLRDRNVAPCRLALLGTGPSEEKRLEKPHDWNHAVLANGKGKRLWYQRKIWPAIVQGADQCASFGIPEKCAPSFYQEYNASASEIVLADIEGLGRVVVLICQDIKGHSFARSIISAFEPDWVLVPILDVGISEGRWMHRECFGISEVANSRFLVVSSLGLAGRASHFGLAVGPAAGGIDDKTRAVLFAPQTPVAAAASPRVSVAYWRDNAKSQWKQTIVGSK